jgi:hypothetical protein
MMEERRHEPKQNGGSFRIIDSLLRHPYVIVAEL